jgi:hypothetical protein
MTSSYTALQISYTAGPLDRSIAFKPQIYYLSRRFSIVFAGPDRHLYVVCLQTPPPPKKKILPDPVFLSLGSKILIVLYAVSKLVHKLSRLNAKQQDIMFQH